MTKKFVVTGALGHIGSFLVRALANAYKNSEIIMIDNLMTQRYTSLFNLPSTAKFRFIEGDVNFLELDQYISKATLVIHLAALTDASNSFGKEKIVEENNFGSTLKIAQACIRENIPLFFPSSTSVYGTQSHEVDETCTIDELKPQSPYAETKLKEEHLLKTMAEKEGLKMLIGRLGTIYGVSPGIRFHTAVNKFCWQSVIGQNLSVWETAYHQRRPYLDIKDAAGAIIYACEHLDFDGEIYNVVTENKTVKEVIEILQGFIQDVKISFVSSKIMNQLSYEVSSEKLLNRGFNYIGEMRQGIQETIHLLQNINHHVELETIS